MIRVLHIATRHKRGGAERNLVESMLWEAEHGYDVHVAVGADSDVSTIPAPITAHHVHALRRDVGLRSDRAGYDALRELIRSLRPDLVHTHQSKAGVLGRIAARGRVQTVVHTVHMPSFGAGYSPIQSRLFRAAERYCAGFTTAIVTVGEELRELYIGAGIGRPEQYHVIPSPIDIDRFARVRRLDREERLACRRELGLSADMPTVVAIGSVEQRKRHRLLLARLAPILASGDAQLLLAGTGPKLESLRLDARQLGVAHAVHLPGFVAEVENVFAVSDAIAHTSLVEGVPQVVIQALAAGVPVVATDAPGLREVPGAPIRIGPGDGSALTEDTRAALSDRSAAVPLDRLERWRPASVAAATAAFHQELQGGLQ